MISPDELVLKTKLWCESAPLNKYYKNKLIRGARGQWHHSGEYIAHDVETVKEYLFKVASGAIYLRYFGNKSRNDLIQVLGDMGYLETADIDDIGKIDVMFVWEKDISDVNVLWSFCSQVERYMQYGYEPIGGPVFDNGDVYLLVVKRA